MKPTHFIFILMLLSLCSINSKISNDLNENYPAWNILSLDGGGIRGLITAKMVQYMETYSY